MCYNNSNPNYATEWKNLDWFSQESNRASADFIPAMLHLARITDIPQFTLTENADLAETLAHTENLRWNAFHAAMGWHGISTEEMQKYFQKTRNANLARKNPKVKRHVCLVS
jgi:hypothetical protein